MSVESPASNFVLSRSGLKNVRLTNFGNGAGVFMRATNYKITCNEFKNLLNDNEEGAPSIMRTLWESGSAGVAAPDGYFANNIIENLQSANLSKNGGWDAEVHGRQGFSTDGGRVKILANRTINAGKRLAKFQNSDGLVASNEHYIRDRQGPLGARKQNSIISVQQRSNRIRAVNNRLRLAAEGRYDGVLAVFPAGSTTLSDIHFDCNDIEFIVTPPAVNYYAQGMAYFSNNATAPDDNNVLINSSAKGNVLRGPGGTNYIFAFKNGFQDTGTGIGLDISGNVINTLVHISDFSGSNATYVP